MENLAELEKIRHSTAHLMAAAVGELWPGTKLAFGPAVEDGFYYDFQLEHSLTPEDFPAIEAKMAEMVKAKLPFIQEKWSRSRAIEHFQQQGQKFKVDQIQHLPNEKELTIYKTGGFLDLCVGPHVADSSACRHFKLLRLSGAYFRGDATGEQLQRLYGTAWESHDALKEYLRLLEEVKKRDHRLLGKEMHLFSFHDEGPGFPFWHQNGNIIFNELCAYLRRELDRRGYQEIRTPPILHESLWHRSGHWDNFQDKMYFTQIDEKTYAVKPMNCPGGALIYRTQQHSYRELPLRFAEFGLVHRHELSGVLHGLFRVRSFTQDDAHVFCLPEQMSAEITQLIDLTLEIYRLFGFQQIGIFIATRPDQSMGEDRDWEAATAALAAALQARGLDHGIKPGEGAFYGPKIEFNIRDCLKRNWQLGTIQVDFSMPQRLDLEYVAADNTRQRPVMIHRAILGSLERFIGILLEHFGGDLPLWVAPVQIQVLPVSEKCNAYAEQVFQQCLAAGLRAGLDRKNEKIGYKIRNAELQRIPYMAVVGEREAQAGTVALRKRKKTDLGELAAGAVISRLQEEIQRRHLPENPT